MVPEKAIPLECGLQDLHAISFNKGCYLGQELTARTHYQGLVRKRLFPVEIIGSHPDPFALITQKGEEVGSLRSVHNNKALALLRIDAFKSFEATQTPLQCQNAVLKPFKPAWMVLNTN
jgi:folate-binding protein YgfZ